jgi:hypothetical protein
VLHMPSHITLVSAGLQDVACGRYTIRYAGKKPTFTRQFGLAGEGKYGTQTRRRRRRVRVGEGSSPYFKFVLPYDCLDEFWGDLWPG